MLDPVKVQAPVSKSVIGDEVVLVDNQVDEIITVEALATDVQTVPQEVTNIPN